MTDRWTIDSISWNSFDPARVDMALLAVVKTAALVEANAADYVVYLRNVFGDDADFVAAAEEWGVEEELHGAALGRWAETADRSWSFSRALAEFRARYKLDLQATDSVRGSRAAELIARQVVETGTSSFYSAIRDAAEEPVLKEIAGRIARDEFFHYQLFAKHFARYQQKNPMSLWAKLKVAATRFNEAEDDELGTAYFCANDWSADNQAQYGAKNYGAEYWKHAMRLYRKPHIDTAVRMIFRAIDLSPNGRLAKLTSAGLWRVAQHRTAKFARAA
jgi:rubrerythrin